MSIEKQQKAEVFPSAFVLMVKSETILLLFLTPGANPEWQI